MTTVSYKIHSRVGKRANVTRFAKDGAELDTVIHDYYQLGGNVENLIITPIMKFGQPDPPSSYDYDSDGNPRRGRLGDGT